MIDVCICTYSPFEPTFERVIRAIINQTLDPKLFRVLVIDNANVPEMSADKYPLSLFKDSNVNVQILREPKLGISYARIRALRYSTADAVVFVDDDNVLDKHFLENTHTILETHKEVGCFSGKICVPEELKIPKWLEPLLPTLAYRDEGESPIIDWFHGEWKPWVPACTASMVVRRSVIESFLEKHAGRGDYYWFGRKGRFNLMSGEDFLIALSAADTKLKCGYFPNLKMEHYVNPDRLTFQYMARLMFSYGISEIKRESYLKKEPKSFSPIEFRYRILAATFAGKGFRARFCQWLYDIVIVIGQTYRLFKRGRSLIYQENK